MVSASDRLTLAVLASFALTAALGGATPMTLVPLVAIASAVLAIATLRSRFGGVVHDVAIVGWILASFEAIGPVIAAVRPRLYDVELSSIDATFFEPMASSWRNAFGRPDVLTDVLSAAYVSFYALPVAVAVALYLRGRRSDYQDFVFAVALAFYLPFFGYLIVPATGPRVPTELAASSLGGGAMASGMRAFLSVVEKNLFDAFPSGHTSVTVVVVARGAVALPRWRVPLVVAGVSIVFSTVYLSLHYVVDVVAGAVLAALVLAAAPALHRLFAALPNEEHVPLHQAVKPPST